MKRSFAGASLLINCLASVLLRLLVLPCMAAWAGKASLDMHRSTKMAGADFACGQCEGSCFAGHCLFDVVDDVAPSVSEWQGATRQPTASHQMSTGMSDQDKFPGSMAAALQQQTAPAANFLPVADLMRSSKGEQQALQGDVAFLSSETSSLRAHLRADEQELQQLRSEKQKLQEQLRIWSNSLAHITEREGHMAELIGIARNGTRSPGSDSQWAHYADSFSAWLMNLPFDFEKGAAIVKDLIFMLVVVVTVCVMYKFRGKILMLLFETEEIKLSWQDIVWSCLSCCHLCWPLEPLGRAVGLTYISVEISEIQLGHLLVGGDVYVSIDIGTNPLLNTRTINKSDGVFLRFKESFKVNVRKTEKPCLFKIMDQDVLMHDQIAQLEINAWEFVNLARKGSADANSGYYRFDLQHRQRRIKGGTVKGFTNPGALRPYIAMRLREVTNDRYGGMGGDFLAKQSQKEFLHTLNSQPGETHFTLDPNTNELKLP
eukprot:gnl/MRDRNA2_/MRDRNA2_90624_c0_seq1.p1 gnl/MRDRNA2_/MRDRNA2_90624_c0~~gnl/MRDRNA2_/MRDRNA2_90624_c0_seq1.p1  ORF type:complete len:488 (-),score=91.70 gnl/MRDRNA2_/MRDRNA2_90624_c0_seq1:9-1472(-)